jgi:hypothetical protein
MVGAALAGNVPEIQHSAGLSLAELFGFGSDPNAQISTPPPAQKEPAPLGSPAPSAQPPAHLGQPGEASPSILAKPVFWIGAAAVLAGLYFVTRKG